MANSSSNITGAASGAASGAMLGSQVMPGWGTLIGGVVGAIGGYFLSGDDAYDTAQTQAGWQRYYAQQQYGLSMMQSAFGMAAAQSNYNMAAMAAGLNRLNSDAILNYNAILVYEAAQYQSKLYDIDLANLYDARDLNILYLEQQRQAEQGDIQASAAASGVSTSSGSVLDVMVSSEHQAMLDQWVVQRNAHVQASLIRNAQAKSLYEGELTVRKMMYEGRMNSLQQYTNTMLNATSNLTAAKTSALGSMFTAGLQLENAYQGAVFTETQGEDQANQAMYSALFNAAGTAIGSYTYGANQQHQQGMLENYLSRQATSGAGTMNFDTNLASTASNWMNRGNRVTVADPNMFGPSEYDLLRGSYYGI